MSLIYESFFFFCASNQNFDFRVLFHQIHNAHDCIDPFFARSNPNVNSCPVYGCCFFQKTIINFINKIGVSRVGSSFWPIYYYICVFDQIIQSSPKFIVHTLILFMLNSFLAVCKKGQRHSTKAPMCFCAPITAWTHRAVAAQETQAVSGLLYGGARPLHPAKFLLFSRFQ